ncbi:NAD(P)-binding protein [Flagelloscypha sp. PMI_526]|nr:NAD(P)-binding protein [Flagelloscypha sp. PMI_526]
MRASHLLEYKTRNLQPTVYPATKASLISAMPHFSTDEIPDMTGQVCIVTGGNSGLGHITAKVLLEKNATVYITARSKTRGDAAIDELEKETGQKANLLLMDLGNWDSIKAASDKFRSQESHLHVLFNNAGVMTPPIEDVTESGFDLQFGTNVLGHFYFTKLLLPALLEAGKSSSGATVIHTSSDAHSWHPKIEYDAMKDTPKRKKIGIMGLYGMSKFANIVFSNELARRYNKDGLRSVSLNPGNLKTNLQRSMNPILKAFLNTVILVPVERGVLTQTYALSRPKTELNGEYLIPCCKVSKPHKNASDAVVGRELWEWMEEQVPAL